MEDLVRICTLFPSIPRRNGAVEVRSTAAVLLRMLLLSPNPRVSVEGASAIMGIMESGFGQYLAQIREAFGEEDVIKRERGYVTYTRDRNEIDATVIKGLFAEVLAIYDPDEDGDMSSDIAEKLIDKLERIVQLYGGNPAQGLSGFSLDIIPPQLEPWALEIETIEYDWMDLWGDVQILHANCRMTMKPNRRTGNTVLKDLMKLQAPSPVEKAFSPLLSAAQMSENLHSHRRAWSIVQDYYVQEQTDVPDELLMLSPPEATPQPISLMPRPLGLTDSAPPNSSDASHHHILQITHLLGISSDSTLALRGAEVEPDECIAKTSRRLYFSGILASKWVVDDGIRGDFEALLKRLDKQEEGPGDVRFLIIDPDGDAYEQLFQLRGGRLSKQSVPFLHDLAARYNSFEVRMVNSLPAFRIVVIDDDFVSFSPYTLDGERYASSRRGWQAPHVVLDPLAPFPLADAFRLHFEERWLAATPLQVLTCDEGKE